MKRTIQLLLLFCLCSFAVFAQNTYSINGVVADTATKSKLARATITILNSKDSILYKFTRSAADGSFSLNNLSQGSYLMLVTFHEYADYAQPFTLDAPNPANDFGQINMTLKATLLKEVIVRGAAITIRGDTTVFNASSYKVQPNARVEDLLLQMPGLLVDQDGKITAQGRPVGKVLVDGEEFFSSDPTLVTRNIRADMVKSIELYDDKSERSKATGLDDPNKVKTLNVVLKDEARNSYFGKVDGGGGQNGYYQGQAMYNNFKPKKKWAVYGLTSNTAKAGISSQDNQKFGTQDNGATYSGQGLPLTRKAGLHYDSKYNKDKETVNLNYSVNRQSVDAIVNMLSQNNLPGNAQLGVLDQTRNNKDVSHLFNGSYSFTISPTSSLSVNANASFINNISGEANIASTTNASNMLLNSSNRTLNNDVNSTNSSVSLNYNKRFKKAGRRFSLRLANSFNGSKGSRFVYAANTFYKPSGAIDSTRIVDQYKPVDNNTAYYNVFTTWSEPLSKTYNLSFNLGIILTKGSNNQESYNKSASGKYDIRDNAFSNYFRLTQLSNIYRANLNYTKEKISYGLGFTINPLTYKQTDLNTKKVYKRNFIIWAPNANYAYRFSQSSSFRLGYSTEPTLPSVDQIQPLRVNTDPLNIVVGNESLKPGVNHYFNANYLSSKQLTGRFLSLTAYAQVSVKQIGSNSTTDAVGKTITQFVNVGKNSSYVQFDATYGIKLQKSSLNIASNFNMTSQHIYNYINGAINKTQYYTLNYYATFVKVVVKKFDFNIRTGPGYRIQYSSLQKELDNNGWVYRVEPTFNIYLPGKTQLGSTVSYLYRTKTVAFPETYNVFICNTTLSKKFFKKDNLVLSLYGNDLFNQNKGFSVSTPYTNSLTLTRYNTIRRYYMLQLTWDFTKPTVAPVQK